MSDYDHLVHFEEGAHSDSTDDPDREVRSPGSVMSDNYYKDPDGNEDHQDSGDNFGEPEDDGDPPEDEDSEPKDDLYKAIVAPRRNLRLGIASAIPSKATTQLQPVVRNSNRPAPAGSKLPENIDTCLDELGLKPSTDSPAARIDFNNDVKAYLAEKLKQKKKDQPTLDTLVTEFGKQYGLKYWGCNNRGRLANPNVETGISWTRELRDQNSRVLAVLKEVLRLKVRNYNKAEYRRQHGRGQKRPSSPFVAGGSPAKRRAAVTDRAPHTVDIIPQKSVPKDPSTIKPLNTKADPSTSGQPIAPAVSLWMSESMDRDDTSQLRVPSAPTVGQSATTKPAVATGGTAKAPKNADGKGESIKLPPAHCLVSSRPQSSLVKDPRLAPDINKQLAAIEQKTEIYLMVSATTKSDRAPVYVPFQPNTTTEDLFASMILECAVGSGSVEECSATLCWKGGARLLIRKGKQDDIDVIQKWICQAWRNDASRFKDGVEIGTLLHVDG